MDPVETTVYNTFIKSDLRKDNMDDIWSDQHEKLNFCWRMFMIDELDYIQMLWLKNALREYYGLPTIRNYPGIGVSVNLSTKSTNGLVTGVASYIGCRNTMEDTHVVEMGSTVSGSFVNDGHGGGKVSELLSQKLKPSMIATMPNKVVQSMFDTWQRGIKGNSGSCCTGAIYGPSGPIRIINVGDSTTFVLKNDGTIVFRSKNHKPTDPEEEKLINALGGSVSYNRVGGSLDVSRAFGDKKIKGVHPKADFTIISDGDIIVSVCDGVTDVMSDEEIAEIITSTTDSTIAAGLLTWKSYKKGSTDNLTAIVTRRVEVGMRYMADMDFSKYDTVDSDDDTEPFEYIL